MEFERKLARLERAARCAALREAQYDADKTKAAFKHYRNARAALLAEHQRVCLERDTMAATASNAKFQNERLVEAHRRVVEEFLAYIEMPHAFDTDELRKKLKAALGKY